MKSRPVLNVAAGVVLLGVATYYVANFASAGTRVRDLCGKMSIGMTVDSLNAFADEVGLGPPARPSGTSFVVEGETFGRYGCRVEAMDGIVKSVKYDSSD